MRKFNPIYLLLLLPFILLFGCEQEEGYDVNVGPKPTLNTLDLLYELKNYTSLLEALELTGMQDAITSAEQKTIFAPNDAAFVALLAELEAETLEDVPVETLREILEYHVVPSAVRAESLPRKLNTLADNSPIYTVEAPAGTVLNGKALIVQQNRTATNGIIQGISFVLDPPKANLIQEVESLESGEEEGDSFSLLLYAIERAGLTSTLTGSTNFTLLAPTDAAFEAAGLGTTADIDAVDVDELKSMLSFHLLDSARFSQEFAAGRIFTTAGGSGVARGLDVAVGDAISFSGSALANPNNVADNGVVHVVRSLVEPYPYLSTRLFNGNPRAIAYYATNSFYKALPQVEGLKGKFMTEEEFHVLSPSNFAVDKLFESLGITSWADLSDEEIIEIVNRHTFAPDLSVGASVGSKITNALGESFFVTENSKGVSINGAVGEAREQVADQVMYIGFIDKYFGNPYFDASAGIYNGTITSITKSLDRIGAIPEATLTEVMANDAEVTLFAAALEKTGVLGSGLNTVFAVDNESFTAATGLASVEEIAALDDAGVDELADFLNGFIASGLYFSNDLSIDLPEVTTAKGSFKLVTDTNAIGGNSLAIQDASERPATTIGFEDVDNIANNGVYHVIEREIVY